MCLEWNNSEPQGRSSWQIWKNTYWSHKCWMRWIWSASWPMACRHHHTMGRIGSLTKKLRVFSALDTCGESTGIHMVHAFTCSSPAWLQDCLWAPCCGKAIPLFCCGMQWWGTTGTLLLIAEKWDGDESDDGNGVFVYKDISDLLCLHLCNRRC